MVTKLGYNWKLNPLGFGEVGGANEPAANSEQEVDWERYIYKGTLKTRVEVVGMKQYVVKPRVADINENVLSEQIQADTALNEDLVKTGVPLEMAIQQIEVILTLQVVGCARLKHRRGLT
uniref:Uncharacterized protein n=1 Tax=Timema bartmani TaxID=61472 RepID=A0A7R9EZW6_9NEOP|nr:unnamed protein product [Timema bartmani]